MKKNLTYFFILISYLLIVSGCKHDAFISKRHYRKGYYLSFGKQQKHAEKQNSEAITKSPSQKPHSDSPNSELQKDEDITTNSNKDAIVSLPQSKDHSQRAQRDSAYEQLQSALNHNPSPLFSTKYKSLSFYHQLNKEMPEWLRILLVVMLVLFAIGIAVFAFVMFLVVGIFGGNAALNDPQFKLLMLLLLLLFVACIFGVIQLM